MNFWSILSISLFLLSLLALLLTPILLVVFVICILLKKFAKISKKFPIISGICLAVCAVSIIPLFVLYIITAPAFWCEHEYAIVEEVAPTCAERGKVVKECPRCGTHDNEYLDKIPHSWEKVSVVDATCTSDGHTIEKCKGCSTTRNTNVTDALGHSMKEFSRTEPTHESEGKIVSRCERCTHEETQTIEKLPPLTYIEGVDYEEIYKDYKANKLRAEDTHKNNRYRVTAKINGMSTSGALNVTGGATLTMLIKIDNTYVFFLAEFEKDQEDALKTVNVGDTITFEGECLSDEMWTNCELITD